MRIQPFRALLPVPGALREADFHFASLRETFSHQLRQGLFAESADDALFLYRISRGNICHVGLLAAVSIHDYLQGCILEHEHTLATRGHIQEALLKKHRASIKPVLLTYRPNEGIADFAEGHIGANPPLLDLVLEGARHELWDLRQPHQVESLTSAFRLDVPKAYIADGHHRMACVARLFRARQAQQGANPYARVFCALFPCSQLEVHEFNRVLLPSGPGMASRIWEELRSACRVSHLPGPERPPEKHALTLYHGGRWYRLSWSGAFHTRCAARGLRQDCEILDEGLLGSWGVKGARLHYLEGPKGWQGLQSEVDRYPLAFGFGLFPIPVEEVMAIADAGKTLPPKSTWFEPRMKTGLISMKLEGGAEPQANTA